MSGYRISPRTLDALAANLDEHGRIDPEAVARLLAEHEPGAPREVEQAASVAGGEYAAAASAGGDDYAAGFAARFGRRAAL